MTAAKKRLANRGMTMLLVVICLIFIVTLMSTMLRQFQLSHRQQKFIAHRAQANALAESAVDRAVFAVQHTQDYDGEIWQIPASDLASRHNGKVVITIQRTDAESVQVDAIAIYPSESDFPTEVHKQFTVRISSPANTEE